MPKLQILIGVPGAGKSTWREKQSAKVFSSDDYRRELYGDLHQIDSPGLFEKLDRDTLEWLSNGGDAIYDATNLSRKKRKVLYEQAKKIGAEVEAVHFLVPLEEAKRRNRLRKGLAVVPDKIIERSFKNLIVAKKGLDCDNISVVGSMTPQFDKFNFPHNNPYHTETLDEHVQYIKENCKTEKEHIIADWHDTGKLDCLVENDKDTPQAKFFRENNNGKFWQYMSHANVSAQYYLSHIQDNLTDENLDNMEHILFHDTELSEKVIRNNNLSPEFVAFNKRFKELDRMGMRPHPKLNEYLEIIKNNKNTNNNVVSNNKIVTTTETPSPSPNNSFHINKKGEIKPCKATKRPCLLGKEAHFSSVAKAQEYLEKKYGD